MRPLPRTTGYRLAIAHGNRGYLHYRRRDMARAIEDYSVQIKPRPDVLAYINRGNAYRDSEQLDRAPPIMPK